MELVWVKVTGTLIMLAGNLLAGLLPLKLVKWLNNLEINHPRFRNSLGIINCFTGGVFLGTFLIHLLPDVTHDFREMLKDWSVVTTFPLAEFTVSIGFFLVLIIESIVTMCHIKHRMEQELDLRESMYGTFHDQSTSIGSDGDDYNDTYEQDYGIQYTPDFQSSMETASIIQETSNIRAFIFIISLSIHSILAGVAIGLQETIDKTITIMVAVDGHKWVIAFALGIELVQASLRPLKCIVFMIVFAAMSPIGVIIGICIDSDNLNVIVQETASCILQALATGTFLYVTFFEVLSKEFSDRHSLLRVLSVIIGFGVMTGFKFLE